MKSRHYQDELRALDISWSEHRWRIGIYTDRGRHREQNEDSVGVGFVTMQSSPLRGLAVLADGVGGQARGEEASEYAVSYMQRCIGLPGTMLSTTLKQMITMTNAVSSSSNQPQVLNEQPEAAAPAEDRPATTLVALLFEGDLTAIGNVGDSRAYLLDATNITQISRDHTDPASGSLTQALGTQLTVEPYLEEVRLEPGQIILLCSDGLTNELRDQEIHRIFLSTLQKGSVQEAVVGLGEQANQRGGRDNISIIAVAYDRVQPSRPAWRSRLALPGLAIASLLIVSAVLLLLIVIR